MATQESNTVEEVQEEISHEITLFAEPVYHVGNFNITNALLTSWAVVVIIIILSLALCSKLKAIPGKLQNLFEVRKNFSHRHFGFFLHSYQQLAGYRSARRIRTD